MTDSDLSSDSTNPKEPDFFASQNVTMQVFIFLLMVPVYVLELCSKKRNRSRSAKYTKRLMLAVFLSNFLHQVTYLVMATTCGHCRAEVFSMAGSRAILRGINQLFLIHRAQLVQGMRPILSMNWFNKILPSIVLVWTIGCLIFAAINNFTNEREWRCGVYVDSETLHYCRDLGDLQLTKEERISVSIYLPWDLVMTIVLMGLFIVPMYRVYSTDLGTMNTNQLRQRMKLKRLLIWSVILTFINQVTSTFIVIFGIFEYQSPLFLLLFFIGLFDAPINVWTSWLMVTRNREYLQRLCCCCCLKADERRLISRQSSAITDFSSRNSRGPLPFSSQSTIEVPDSVNH